MSKQKQSGLSQADKVLNALENAGPRAKQLSNSFLRGIMSGNTPPQKMVNQLKTSTQGTQLQPFMKQMTETTKSELNETTQGQQPPPKQEKPYKRGAHGIHQASGSVEISSIHVHNTDVMFDETVDVYFYARDEQYDDLNWEYTWSGAHSETVKVDQSADSIKARLSIPETNAVAGDQIHIDATVRDSSGDTDKRGITLNIIGQKMAAVDVWFDTENAQSTERVDLIGDRPPPPPERDLNDPIIFDLDMDGEIGMGGKNIEGDGSLDGDTVLFDMAPDRSSWAFVSSSDVPGEDAPRLRNGHVVYENGDTESIGSDGVWRPPADSRGRFQHPRAQLYNSDNQWVMEWVRTDDDTYDLFWGNREDKERTEWLKKGTGDGFLVWDKNNNGMIDDNTELFSEFDMEGNEAFATGFEKLAHYFDKDGDGVIKGSELNGLKFWVDSNADAQTDSGELKELSEYGITEIKIPKTGELRSTGMVGKSPSKNQATGS